MIAKSRVVVWSTGGFAWPCFAAAANWSRHSAGSYARDSLGGTYAEQSSVQGVDVDPFPVSPFDGLPSESTLRGAS